MPYQVLARKWRPKKFEDVVGQPHITRSLKNAILRGEIGHAYLFTGTRGIGKTSVARIFAKAIQCQKLDREGNPCLTCSTCLEIDFDKSLDVIEIDGASHNGVDHIRQLVENIQYLPVSGKKRIYIIDEVHMLTKEAFNALLKTLEEPPSHVIFLFATTVPEKLLGTVLSRCQRFDFRNVLVADITDYLLKIAAIEGILVDSPILLKQVALEAKGSMRDALSLLDQVLSFSKDRHIEEVTVVESLGIARTSAIRDMLSSILLCDSSRCSKVYREVLTENVELGKLALSLLDGFYEIIINRQSLDSIYQKDLVAAKVMDNISHAELFWIYESLAKDLQWSLRSLDPEKITEIVLQKVCARRDFLNENHAISREGPRSSSSPEEEKSVGQFEPKAKLEREKSSEQVETVLPLITNAVQPVNRILQAEPNVSLFTSPNPPLGLNEKKSWKDFLKYLFGLSPGLAANVEHGNIINSLEVTDQGLRIDLRFRESGKVFLDYLKEKETWERFLKFIAEFYSLPLSKIFVTLDLIATNGGEGSEFKTYVELEKVKTDETFNKQREEFLSNIFIKKAEELFNAKIDRVIIQNQLNE